MLANATSPQNTPDWQPHAFSLHCWWAALHALPQEPQWSLFQGRDVSHPLPPSLSQSPQSAACLCNVLWLGILNSIQCLSTNAHLLPLKHAHSNLQSLPASHASTTHLLAAQSAAVAWSSTHGELQLPQWSTEVPRLVSHIVASSPTQWPKPAPQQNQRFLHAK